MFLLSWLKCKYIRVPILTLSISYRHRPMRSHWKMFLQGIPDTPCHPCYYLKAKCDSPKKFSILWRVQSWPSFIFNVKKKKKKGFTASKRCVVPLGWAPYPGLQALCCRQNEQSSLLEQWNPSVHLQMVSFLVSWTGTSKLRSERRMDTNCKKKKAYQYL